MISEHLCPRGAILEVKGTFLEDSLARAEGTILAGRGVTPARAACLPCIVLQNDLIFPLGGQTPDQYIPVKMRGLILCGQSRKPPKGLEKHFLHVRTTQSQNITREEYFALRAAFMRRDEAAAFLNQLYMPGGSNALLRHLSQVYASVTWYLNHLELQNETSFTDHSINRRSGGHNAYGHGDERKS